MRILVLAIFVLSACASGAPTPTLTPAAMKAITNLCTQDAMLQPMAAGFASGVGAAVPTAGPFIVGGAAVDNTVLHPLVLDACAKVQAMPPGSSVSPAPVAPDAAAKP